jgi:hypothetical protein
MHAAAMCNRSFNYEKILVMNTATTQKNMKQTKIIYWIFTSIIVLFDSVLPAFTFNTQLAKDGISHVGYPDYFRIELSIGKIIGGILLILPMIPPRFKEWAYVGFGINLISAFIAHIVVDGVNGQSFFPLIVFAILVVSYISYHKLLKASNTKSVFA